MVPISKVFFSKCRSFFQNFWVFASKNLKKMLDSKHPKFWTFWKKIDPCLRVFLWKVDPCLSISFEKTTHLVGTSPYSLYTWVPPVIFFVLSDFILTFFPSFIFVSFFHAFSWTSFPFIAFLPFFNNFTFLSLCHFTLFYSFFNFPFHLLFLPSLSSFLSFLYFFPFSFPSFLPFLFYFFPFLLLISLLILSVS